MGGNSEDRSQKSELRFAFQNRKSEIVLMGVALKDELLSAAGLEVRPIADRHALPNLPFFLVAA